MKSFRNRLILTFFVVVLVPLVALALIVRSEMTRQLTRSYEAGIDSTVASLNDDLRYLSHGLREQVQAIRLTILDDNRFRNAVVSDAGDRSFLLDYAGRAMDLAGLTVFQIQDASGRIVSSGHFRNEFDRLDAELPDAVNRLQENASILPIALMRTPGGPSHALVTVDSIFIGGQAFSLVAGMDFERSVLDWMQGHVELSLGFEIPGSGRPSEGPITAGSNPGLIRTSRFDYIDASRAIGEARVVFENDLADLRALRTRTDTWFVLVFVLAVLVSAALVHWNASRLSRPLVRLAEKTSQLDLDRLDVSFATPRKDEVGVLARRLDALTARLRSSLFAVKDAERRAVVGDLARQVNHDVKNGLTPIRNILRHFCEVASCEPERLAEVFQERVEALESSVAYLEELSVRYARLRPESRRIRCDLVAIAGSVGTEYRGMAGARIRLKTSRSAILVGDPVALRRIVENLVDNAVDSLGGGRGTVTVSVTRDESNGDQPLVRLVVEDTGCGMSEEEQIRAFNDFYSGKEDGTGLGLSIVRRLVMDLGGSVRVESEMGRGSRFIVELPAAGAEDVPGSGADAAVDPEAEADPEAHAFRKRT